MADYEVVPYYGTHKGSDIDTAIESAATALQPEDVTDEYSASGTSPVNGKAVASAISGKQDALSQSQLAAVNSGITSTTFGNMQSSVSNLNKSTKHILDGKPKNILNWSIGTYSTITVTKNDDNSFTISGQPTSAISAELMKVYGHAGEKFWLSGCPAGGSQANGYSLLAANQAGSMIIADEGSGCSFTAPAGEDYFRIYLRLRPGTYTNLKFSPMLCFEEDANISKEYVPYYPTEYEIYTQKQDLLNQQQLDAVNSGATKEIVSEAQKYCCTPLVPYAFSASDYEQGGIGSSGALADSVKFIRTKGYVPTNVGSIDSGANEVYVKIYKNGSFVGNWEHDGTINETNHHSFRGTVGFTPIYQIDPEYRLKLVYTHGSTTEPADIVEIKPYVRVPLVLTGKKVSIFGDSISTYTGYIPAGNATYYDGSNAGVADAYQTWWMRTVQSLGGTLLVNNSWSGRCVSNKRDSESGLTDSGAWRQTEVDKLASSGTNPDVILVKLGINDFNHNVQEGTYDGTTSLPDPNTAPTTFREAYAIMMHRIMTTYPLARVYCCLLNQCERSGDPGFPEINASGSAISEFNVAIKQLAAAFGAGVIDHGSAGMTYYNLSTYAGDYSQQTGDGLHPNAKGMKLLADKTVSAIVNDSMF